MQYKHSEMLQDEEDDDDEEQEEEQRERSKRSNSAHTAKSEPRAIFRNYTCNF